MKETKKYTVSVFTTMRDAMNGCAAHEHLTPECKLAPWEQIKFMIEDVTKFVKNRDTIYASMIHGVSTTSDHIVNGIRLCVERGIIDHNDVEITFHGNGMVGIQSIRVDNHGSLDKYPDGFMDTWGNVLMELLVPNEERTETVNTELK